MNACGTELEQVVVIHAGKERWEEGVQLVLSVQALTGLPDPTVWPPALLAPHTRDRQREALGVWLAMVGGRVIGHALILNIPATHPDWAQAGDPATCAALAAGVLVESGGLAVAPAYMRRGVAGAMLHAQLSWLDGRPDLLPVASVWHASAGSTKLATRYARKVGCGVTGPFDLYAYEPVLGVHAPVL